jgi:TnpA family transposase
VSDLYILLFSHFVSCSVYEANYILDILMRNQSTNKPTTIHADTHGQNLPFLDCLLGFQSG